MIKKILLAIGLGTSLDIASLVSSDKINAIAGKEVTERGFPFSYLERAESSIAGKAPETEFIFSNATYNLIFWIAIASIVVYVMFWIFAKFSKLVFILSVFAVVGLLLAALVLG